MGKRRPGDSLHFHNWLQITGAVGDTADFAIMAFAQQQRWATSYVSAFNYRRLGWMDRMVQVRQADQMRPYKAG